LAGIRPIVCTSTEPEDDEIASYCAESGVSYFRGALNNKLKRWYDCAVEFKVSDFHTVDCDDPFFDPELVFESINILRATDYDVVFPTEISSKGSASVGYSINTNSMKSINGLFEESFNSEMVDQIFLNTPELKVKTLVTNHAEIDNVRLTLDYPEDYILIRCIDLMTKSMPTRADLQEVLKNNPDLSLINRFRTEEWAINQQKLRKGQSSQLQ
jgi:spore coat polysaccharide biosynthesis protein SpsF